MGGTVNLDEMIDTPVQGNGGPRDITRESAQWRAAVYGRLGTTVCISSEIQQLALQEFKKLQNDIRILKAQVRVLSNAPARRLGRSTSTAAAPPERRQIVHVGPGAPTQEGPPATLYPRPRRLQQLWEEWVSGIDGRKPACEFTSYERGQVKSKFCLRKPFWLLMERLIKTRGFDTQTALNKVHQVYCGSTMTNMLKRIQEDEDKGGHQRLYPFPVERLRRDRRSRRPMQLRDQ